MERCAVRALHSSPSTSSCVATGRQHHGTVTRNVAKKGMLLRGRPKVGPVKVVPCQGIGGKGKGKGGKGKGKAKTIRRRFKFGSKFILIL